MNSLKQLKRHPDFIVDEYKAGDFKLVFNDLVADLFVEKDEFVGVEWALSDLQADVFRVTDKLPSIKRDQNSLVKNTVIVGTIDGCQVIKDLIINDKLDVNDIKGKTESYVIQTVKNPLPNVDLGLVVAGSDCRGAIYGIYELSRQIGVSPWYWWADVTSVKRDNLVVMDGIYKQGEPSVKYRGIFLNNEAPSLSSWVERTFGGFNHKFYVKIFELILRLRGNFLWPAMWSPKSFFRDDPLNTKLADEYGIVVGTSHHEPMMRSWGEWGRFGEGDWNYSTNKANLLKFWEDGVRNTKDYEKIVTIGMRGDGDEPMMDDDAPLETKIEAMENIITRQRKILAEVHHKDTEDIPQVLALYKEVQEFYENGLDVPDDVTVLLANDNFGNIRMLPKPEERHRSGGYGMYYHWDYVGGPRSYRWVDTVPFPKTWEQMKTTYDYGVDKIWVVNVGDLKGHEVPTEFFLEMAYDINKWHKDNLDKFTIQWAEREFGAQYASSIGEIVTKYIKYNGRRKPEHVRPDTYSLVNYKEAETVLRDFEELVEEAEDIYAMLPDNLRDAFFQLVLYPTRGSKNVLKLNIYTGLNHMYADEGRAIANDYAKLVETVFHEEAADTEHYNGFMANGKWNGVMRNGHIGQTGWRIPEKNMMPKVKNIDLEAGSEMGIAVEGTEQVWTASDVIIEALPTFSSLTKEKFYIEIFNLKTHPFTVKLDVNKPWIIVPREIDIDKQERIWIDIDWEKAPIGERINGEIYIEGTGKNAAIKIDINNLDVKKFARLERMTFIESNGYISIEAEHYQNNIAVNGVQWKRIPDYGRTLSSMAVFPNTCSTANPPENSPYLEYSVYVSTPGELTVTIYTAPSNNIYRKRGLCYGISFDEQPIQIVDTFPKENDAFYTSPLWSIGVMENVRKTVTRHEVNASGVHKLQFWMVDPTVVLQKIVIDMGGVKPSYLGPPESYFVYKVSG